MLQSLSRLIDQTDHQIVGGEQPVQDSQAVMKLKNIEAGRIASTRLVLAYLWMHD
jgi:hypothetical protein